MKRQEISKGDVVVMVNCVEAHSAKNMGRRFIVSSDPHYVGGSEVCALMYENSCAMAYSAFSTENLRRVG